MFDKILDRSTTLEIESQSWIEAWDSLLLLSPSLFAEYNLKQGLLMNQPQLEYPNACLNHVIPRVELTGSCVLTTPRIPSSAFTQIPNTNHEQVAVKPTYTYKCTYGSCGKTFTRRAENAKAHWMAHMNVALFRCGAGLCGQSFRRRVDLKRHLQRVHGNDCVFGGSGSD